MKVLNSEGKKEIRSYLISLLKNGDSILTLPSSNWIFEEELCKKVKPSNLIGFEKNPKEWALIQKRSTGYYGDVAFKVFPGGRVLKIIKGDIIESLQTSYELKEKFNFIWVDLCASITPKLITDLLEVFQQQKKARVIAVTLFLQRTLHLELFKDVYGIKNTKEMVGVLCDLLEHYSNYKLKRRIDYLTPQGKGTSSLTTIVFERI